MLEFLQQEIVDCRLCPRLREHCSRIAEVKRRAYREWEYWGRPVPSFGDLQARLLILGLAPGAHGSNRTGRMFTGDRSGDMLYRALHKTGFASQPASISQNDGLTLYDAYITAVAHCAPPGNKPTPEEIRNCRPYLERELALLANLRVVVALGKIAFDGYLEVLKRKGAIPQPRGLRIRAQPRFPDERGLPLLVGSYHPSQQNTSTGKLTEPMLVDVFRRAREAVEGA